MLPATTKTPPEPRPRPGLIATALLACLLAGCAHTSRTRMIETTAYCPCDECNGFTRGTWYCLWLDRWNRRFVSGPNAGELMTHDTASGAAFQPPSPGLLSLDSLLHPWWIPVRLIFPWLWLPARGTIAADTNYYPFGTRMTIPGWGRGIVTDRGSAIQGPDRLDLLFRWHSQTEAWGRRRVEVQIEE